MRPRLALAALLGLAAAAASAGAWTVRDLGQTYRERDCVEAARRAFEDEATAFGGGPVRVAGWTVTAADLGRRGYDGLVACAYGANAKTRATLAVHAPTDDLGRVLVANRLEIAWRAYAKRLDRAYIESLRD